MGEDGEVSSGRRVSVPTDVADKVKSLEREVRKLRQVNEMLCEASSYFTKAQVDTIRLPSNDTLRRGNLSELQVLKLFNVGISDPTTAEFKGKQARLVYVEANG